MKKKLNFQNLIIFKNFYLNYLKIRISKVRFFNPPIPVLIEIASYSVNLHQLLKFN
jgi:hypothetical protein